VTDWVGDGTLPLAGREAGRPLRDATAAGGRPQRSCVVFASAREFLDRSNRDTAGCIVLDVTMPDFTGLELQEVLSATRSILPIIFLTGYADVPKAVRALKGGAADFLSKPVEKDELLDAIDRAIRTNRVARAGLFQRAHDAQALRLLTAREYEVFVQVATGKPNKVIAADLGTCEQTIKVHRGRVMKKLRVNSLAELVRLADRTGIRRTGARTPRGGEGSEQAAGFPPPA
jgi:FixJ family two-component response regulator